MQPAGKLDVKMASWEDQWSLWAIGDVHLLNRGCHERLFDETLERIAEDDNALWAGMGDFADLISMQDKRFDPEAIDGQVSIQKIATLGPVVRDMAIEKLKPVAHKCIGFLEGNHEWSYDKRFEQALSRDVVDALNTHVKEYRGPRGAARRAHSIPFMHYSGFRDLVFRAGRRDRTFRVCMHHGAGYAATKGGKLNRLLKFMGQFDCDIFLMGHVHTVTDDVVVQIAANEACDHLTHKTKVGVITGTFLRTYVNGASGYGERKGYDPVPLGAPRIWVDPSDVDRPLGVEKPW